MRFFLVLLMFIAIPFQAQAQSTCDTTALPGRKLVWVGKTLEVGAYSDKNEHQFRTNVNTRLSFFSSPKQTFTLSVFFCQITRKKSVFFLL